MTAILEIFNLPSWNFRWNTKFQNPPEFWFCAELAELLCKSLTSSPQAKSQFYELTYEMLKILNFIFFFRKYGPYMLHKYEIKHFKKT